MQPYETKSKNVNVHIHVHMMRRCQILGTPGFDAECPQTGPDLLEGCAQQVGVLELGF